MKRTKKEICRLRRKKIPLEKTKRKFEKFVARRARELGGLNGADGPLEFRTHNRRTDGRYTKLINDSN